MPGACALYDSIVSLRWSWDQCIFLGTPGSGFPHPHTAQRARQLDCTWMRAACRRGHRCAGSSACCCKPERGRRGSPASMPSRYNAQVEHDDGARCNEFAGAKQPGISCKRLVPAQGSRAALLNSRCTGRVAISRGGNPTSPSRPRTGASRGLHAKPFLEPLDKGRNNGPELRRGSQRIWPESARPHIKTKVGATGTL